jgi:uncharacterized Rossmann fold enzyme
MTALKKLDLYKTEVKTAYCISPDIREDQIRISISCVQGRFEPAKELSNEPLAVVCYGPSLRKTWQELKKFKNIITCSGAHKFLIDRGIIPTWHVDLDPREHKVQMLGEPHKDVQYLMASTCHPKMWEKLEGFNLKLWHIFNGEQDRNLPVAYPRGEWILTGGNNVGMRCMVLGRLLGFRDQHVFGMDCSFPKEGSHHADIHLNAHPKLYQVPHDGKIFYCEPVMLVYARQFFHEVKQLPDVHFSLYGDGLLQHMAYSRRDEKIQTKRSVAIAFSTPLTITGEHLEKMKTLHKNPVYGVSGRKHADVVLKLSESLKTRSVMDYGCGKGTLCSSLPFPIWEYDPAIPGKDGVPRPSDLVVCLNVLECVEPHMIDNVLADLARCSKRCVFAVIGSTDKETWEKRLNHYFKVGGIFPCNGELHCVLEPRSLGPLG